MEMLIGQSINQLTDLGSANRISADDMFFISHPLTRVSAYTEYTSKSLSYGSLVRQLFADLSAGFGFKSMAYEPEDGYSRTGHSHPYNKFDIRSNVTPTADTKLLATFKVDDRKIRLYMPRQYAYIADDPIIGELRFRMLPTVANPGSIDVNSPNFDGWVYPRGQTYQVGAGDFRPAKKLFGKPEDGNELSVPNIDNFVRMDPAPNSVQKYDYSIGSPPPHIHSSAVLIKSDDASVKIKAETTSSAGAGQKIHNGKDPYNPEKYYYNQLVFRAKQFVMKDPTVGYSEAWLSREQYPSYNYLPVMIYIGKKR